MQRRSAAPGDAVTVIDADQDQGSPPAEYRRYKTLFLFLTARDIRLRYRKTWRGVLWALIQPLLPMLIFAAIFSRVIRPELSTGPYWLFVLAGIAPWNFFANAVNYSSVTFVNNFGLLNKVYFPRAILPAAAVTACLLDLLVSSTVLIGLGWWNGYPPTLRYFLLPPAILAGVAVAGVIGLAAASLNVLYRDLKPLVPFLIQVAMYATPVLYPLAMIPAGLRRLAWIDPMTGVVEAFRAGLFGTSMDWAGEAISGLAFCVFACGAAWLFGKVEADLAERI
jgi:lipopolysaccharide transport system permease protein